MLMSRLAASSGEVTRRSSRVVLPVVGRASSLLVHRQGIREKEGGCREAGFRFRRQASTAASSPSLSIWRRKKEMGKEGLFVVHELKRISRSGSRGGARLEGFIRCHVSRLVRTDLFAVLAELQRQDLVALAMKIYSLVRKEIWYRPDMFFYRDMLMMLARNKRAEEAKQVWLDAKGEEVQFDQHTYGDIVRAFCDGQLPTLAMEFYDEMRQSPDPPLSLPFRVMLKGLVPYPDLRQKVKDDFLELFPGMVVFDPPEDTSDDKGRWEL